jgi:hypothetical protein
MDLFITNLADRCEELRDLSIANLIVSMYDRP